MKANAALARCRAKVRLTGMRVVIVPKQTVR
jgi:hypothetical protein